MKVLVLAGGVGGAKLAAGLAQVLPAEDITVVVNTGDDFEHLGLPVSPDLDTVMYTLAGVNDVQRGWGLAGESWAFMAQLGALGGEDWFQLGDRDLATHVLRRQLRAGGLTLSQATARLSAAFGVGPRIVPMSDDPVRTWVETAEGALAFQHYFVRERCAPVARAIRFEGIAAAAPSPGFREALADPQLGAIVLAPSNPFVSIAPILGLAGIATAVRAARCPVVAVSPIVGGAAIKGPAAKMMRELGLEVSAAGVAAHYAGLLDGFVMDSVDAALAAGLSASGIGLLVTDTVMKDAADRTRLGEEVLAFVRRLGSERGGNTGCCRDAR